MAMVAMEGLLSMPMEAAALSTEAHRAWLAMVGMVVMDMEAMASVRLSQAMVVLLFIPMVVATARGLPMLMQDMVDMGLLLSMFPRLTMDMATTHNLSPMVTILARGLLMLDTMVVLALMSTRPVLTTMDLTDMVSTTMARGQLMLD